MSSLAHTALAASIVLSALGAVVICLLTAMFGFTPPSEEPPAQATRRLFLTRVGHAVAAACFAGTAILLAVVLGQPTRATSPAGGDARVPALASKLDAHMERLEGVERRMKESEHALERLEAEVSDVTAQRIVPEPAPAAAAPKAVERPRAAAAPAKPAERPTVTVTPPQRSTVTVTPPPRPSPAPARPGEPPAVAAESPKDGEEPAASPAPAPSPKASPPAPGPRSSREAPPPPPPADFRSKLRDDWRAIRRGWESAGDDFKSAIDRLRRPN